MLLRIHKCCELTKSSKCCYLQLNMIRKSIVLRCNVWVVRNETASVRNSEMADYFGH